MRRYIEADTVYGEAYGGNESIDKFSSWISGKWEPFIFTNIKPTPLGTAYPEHARVQDVALTVTKVASEKIIQEYKNSFVMVRDPEVAERLLPRLQEKFTEQFSLGFGWPSPEDNRIAHESGNESQVEGASGKGTGSGGKEDTLGKFFVGDGKYVGDGGEKLQKLWCRWEWCEINNCPGRYVVKNNKSICSMSISELLSDEKCAEEIPIKLRTSPKCVDPVQVARFVDGGGVITFCKPDSSFVHTLNTESGLKRKLESLELSDLL